SLRPPFSTILSLHLRKKETLQIFFLPLQWICNLLLLSFEILEIPNFRSFSLLLDSIGFRETAYEVSSCVW
ncbi:hypothetical protein LINPERPRIM_LOCUS5056, partial [Linum perenne]